MMTDAQPWDMWSKLVVTVGIADVLRHAGVEVDARRLRPRSGELPSAVRRADLLLASEDCAQVVHVEIQHRADPAIGLRMLGYAARIAEHRDYRDRIRDLVQIVVQVTGARPMAVDYRLGLLRNGFHLVHVPSLPIEDLLASPTLAPLAMVVGGSAAVRGVVERIARVDPGELRIAMLGLALGLDPVQGDVIMDELRRAGMTDVVEQWRHTRWGRDLMDQGRQEGRQEGEDAARLAAVRDVLSSRFPGVDDGVVDRVARRLVAADSAGAIREALALPSLR